MNPKVAVTSRSLSKHPVLRAELESRYPGTRFNDAGASLKGDALVSFLDGCEKAIIALETVDNALLARLPSLKVISKFGVGLDSFDIPALARRGLKLAWTPGTNSRSVAELALLSSMALLRRLPEVSEDMRAGTWRQLKGGTLSGRTVGLVGLGAVAREFVVLLGAFDVRLLAHDPAADLAFAQLHSVGLVTLEEVLRESDIVSLHVPLLPDTRNLMSAENLARMKPSAFLINTARGGLVDETALLAALDDGRLAGAALDVFSAEPMTDKNLATHPKLLATPHIGGSTEEAILAMGRAAIAGLDTARDAGEFLRR